jgi:hypothetical protein
LVFLLVTIVFPVDLSGVAIQLQYYNMLSNVAMYFPATVDSLVTMLLIGHYRKVALVHFHKFSSQIHLLLWKKTNEVTPIGAIKIQWSME